MSRHEIVYKHYAMLWDCMLPSTPIRQRGLRLLEIVGEEEPENLKEGPRKNTKP